MPAFIRIYADDDGDSHFEDLDLQFEEEDLVPPAPPVDITAFEPAIEYCVEKVPPGWSGDWHPPPGRVLAIYLSGEGEMEASDGETRPLLPGTVLLAEDTTGRGHISRVSGSEDMYVVLVTLPDE